MTKIYKITDGADTDGVYIGKTSKTLQKRFRHHLYLAPRVSYKFYLWLRNHPTAKIELIEEIDNSVWQERERFWIKWARETYGEDKCLNTLDGGEADWTGRKHSEESKKRMSLIKLGKKASDETRRRLSLARQNISEETKRKMAIANRIKNLGRKRSEEYKKKMSLAKKNPSEETRRKISLARQNLSEDTKQRLSLVQTGKKHSEETRKRMSESQKLRRLKESIKLSNP